MAFFKFRKGGEDQASAAPQPESVEVMRKRAKHRLIGAVVLVLAGVIGFPLLVDKQPRPVAVDIPIEIPDKNKTKPLVSGTLSNAPADIITETAADARSTPPATASPEVVAVPVSPAKPMDKAAADKPAEKSVDKTADKAGDKAVDKPAEKSPEKSPEKTAEKAADKSKPADKDGARAQALLEGKEPAKTASEDRYVVQVGAFSDAAKAREARLKVERDGLKTYTQVVESKEGRRIRVRVGPFGSKAEADKAADKIKKLDLPAAILSL